MVHRLLLVSIQLLFLSLPSWATSFPADSAQPGQPASSTVSLASRELTVRVNYTSRAVFSGRDFGVNEWMSTPSITYYAKSGFYADITGYYFSQSLPHYELTAVSAGYLGIVSSVVAVSGELSRSFLSQSGQQNLLPYSSNLSVNYTVSPVLSANADYYLMFGNVTAHRLRLSLSAYASHKVQSSVLGLKRISCIPAFTAILGTETSALSVYQPGTPTATTPGTITTPLTAAERRLQRLQQRIQAKRTGAITPAVTPTVEKFGLMALDLAVPIRATFTGFRLGLTNHLVKPVKIYADEDISTNPIYYADISLTWVIN